MKIHKVLCDACGKDINLEEDRALGAFQYLSVNKNLLFKGTAAQQDDSFEKDEFDLCKDCSEKIKNVITEIKNESK
jgi:hypothetical protein